MTRTGIYTLLHDAVVYSVYIVLFTVLLYTASHTGNSMFGGALARGPESSAEDGRCGPGSYRIPSTLMDHPTVEKPQYTKFALAEERSKLPAGAEDGGDPDAAKITRAVKLIISTSKRPPTIKFGTSKRPDYGSLSATRNSRFMVPNGQVGEAQPTSGIRTAPKYSLAGRCKLSMREGERGLDTPGPEYILPEVMGTAPTPGFGTAVRDGEDATFEETPGPGAFQMPPAIGVQVESRLRSSASTTLVGGGRDQFGAAFGAQKGHATPSPAKYRPENCRHAVSKGVPQVTMGVRFQDPSTVGQGEAIRVGPGSCKFVFTLSFSLAFCLMLWSQIIVDRAHFHVILIFDRQVADHFDESSDGEEAAV